MGCIKLEIFLPKNQHTQRKFLNFENWTNEEHQFVEKKRALELIVHVKKLNN